MHSGSQGPTQGGCQGSSLQTPGARFQFLFLAPSGLFLASSWPLPGRFLASSWPLGVFLGSPWVGRLFCHSLSDMASSLAACSRGEGLRVLQLGGWDGRDAFSLSFVSVTWFRLTQRHKEDLLACSAPKPWGGLCPQRHGCAKDEGGRTKKIKSIAPP